VGGFELELRPLAEEICRRYRGEFLDEEGRYGEAGAAWCVHDNQHILNWAVLSVTYASELLAQQVDWLASVLRARDFPAGRLKRDLELARDVVRELHPAYPEVADALNDVAAGI
jgi:hypothetical protein